MTEAEIGYWLMLGAAILMGAVIGFRLNKGNGSGFYVGIYGGFLGYIFYVGALMLAPEAKALNPENFSTFFVVYPLATVMTGAIVVGISTLICAILFFFFNKFVRWYHPRLVGE